MIILSNVVNGTSTFSYIGVVLQLLFLIFVFIIVLLLAYYSTKFIAGAKIKNMKKNNMKVIETISIGFNHLHIVEVNKKYFLISSSKEGIRLLTEIDGDGLEFEQHTLQSLPFEKHMKNYLQNFQSKNTKGDKDEK